MRWWQWTIPSKRYFLWKPPGRETCSLTSTRYTAVFHSFVQTWCLFSFSSSLDLSDCRWVWRKHLRRHSSVELKVSFCSFLPIETQQRSIFTKITCVQRLPFSVKVSAVKNMWGFLFCMISTCFNPYIMWKLWLSGPIILCLHCYVSMFSPIVWCNRLVSSQRSFQIHLKLFHCCCYCILMSSRHIFNGP